MHFQISLSLSELYVIRNWLCVRDIAETSLNSFFKLLLVLKSYHRSYSVEKGVVKNFTGKHLYWSLFLIGLQVVSQRRCSPLKFSEICKFIKSSCNFIYNAWEKIQIMGRKQNPLKHICQSFLALNYFYKKVPSSIFDRILNTPLSSCTMIVIATIIQMILKYLMDSVSE